MKEPLHHDELFGKVWAEFFDKKGAVAPSFQHSDKLKALLVAAQKENAGNARTPTTDQPLAAIIECFSFAKQRFNSTVDPCAKVALMLLPLCFVLAFCASDTRSVPTLRKRYEASLKFMTSKNVFGLGLSADWGIVWETVIRVFDAGDHDIAASSEEIEGLIWLLTEIFVGSRIFEEQVWRGPLPEPAIGGASLPAIGGASLPPTIAHNMKAVGLEGQFISNIVKNQIKQKWAFNVNGVPIVLWGALSGATMEELAGRIQNVAKVSIGRVRSDFPKTEMRFFLRAFSMPLVKAAFGPQGQDDKQRELNRCLGQALANLKFPECERGPTLSEYGKLAKLLSALAQPGQPLAASSNREAWGCCLEPSFLQKHLPGESFQQLPKVIQFYESILDGSCGVERGLAQVRAFISEHLSTDIDVLDDLAVVLDAKLQPADFAKEVHGFWEAGPVGLECGALWRELLGARMGIYGKHVAPQVVKPGTFKSVKAGVLKAIGAVTVSRDARRQPLAAQAAPTMASVLAERSAGGASSSAAGTPKSPFWHKGSFYPNSLCNADHGHADFLCLEVKLSWLSN